MQFRPHSTYSGGVDLETHPQIAVWPFLFVLAAVVGFAAERASLCTVKAVKEILSTRRAYMRGCFAKTVVWVVGITMLLAGVIEPSESSPSGFALLLPTFLGGIFFGIGAVLNRGCSLSTLTRLGSGHFGMIVTLAGFGAGVTTYEWIQRSDPWRIPVRAAPWFDLYDRFVWMIGIILGLWMLWEGVRLWRTAPKTSWRKRLSAPQYRLSTAAAVMGVSNGILFALVGTWSYTHTLHHGIVQLIRPESLGGDRPLTLLWCLFIALVVGVFSSAFLGRRFVIVWRPGRSWIGYFGGGGLMGFGARLIPGGNDVLLLNAIPGFSPHGLPAYMAMLVGMAITLIVLKRFGLKWSEVTCRGDVCQESKASSPRSLS